MVFFFQVSFLPLSQIALMKFMCVYIFDIQGINHLHEFFFFFFLSIMPRGLKVPVPLPVTAVRFQTSNNVLNSNFFLSHGSDNPFSPHSDLFSQSLIL